MQDCRQRRCPAPELYRIALMFGICLLHSITQGGYNKPWLSNILLSCVNGFIFISGYYGLTFKPSKVIRLFAVSVFCGLLIYAAGYWQGVYPPLSFERETLKLLRGILVESWFVTAYAVLLFIAPLIDGILKWVPKRALPAILCPFFLLAFGWSFGLSVPFLCGAFPHAPELGNYTGLSLIATYTCARLIKLFGLEAYFTRKRLLIACGVLCGIATLGLGDYASPFAVALAAAIFYLFKSLVIPPRLGKVILLLSPSMFAIYLLHSSRIGFSFIQYAERFLLEHHVPVYAAFVLVAAVIFFSCLLLDLPRRLLCALADRPLTTLPGKLDGLYERAVASLSAQCRGE